MTNVRPTPTLHSRILIIENHKLVADGLKQLLEPEFSVPGIVTDDFDVVRRSLALMPEVILWGTSTSLLDSVQLARQITETAPETKIIYLAVNTDPNFAIEAFDHGCASGYLLKTCSASELKIAVRSVLKGHSYLSPSLKDMVDRLRWEMNTPIKGQERRNPVNESERLTERQREILLLLIEGNTMGRVGSALRLTPRTVAYHKYRIKERIGARSDADLVKFAVRTRLLAQSLPTADLSERVMKASAA